MRIILICLFFPFCVLGQPNFRFELEGQLKFSEPVRYVLLEYNNGQRVRDSIPMDGSSARFHFHGTVAEPTFARLRLGLGNAQKSEASYGLFLDTTNMKLSVDSAALLVEGSAAHRDYELLRERALPFSRRLDSLSILLRAYYTQQKQAEMVNVGRQQYEVQQDLRAVYLRFVKEHPESRVAFYALQLYTGYDYGDKSVSKLFDRLPASTRSWPGAVVFAEKLARVHTLERGYPAIDFVQPDTLGVPLSLSSFRGKYVLVDFWASWCGPCRKESPFLVTAYQQFKDQNFTILSVSLDQPNGRDKWLKAIHDDGLTWTHVSDLKFWDNEAAKLYLIKSIPDNFLIDPDGVIIARGLRGEELERKLKKVLGRQ